MPGSVNAELGLERNAVNLVDLGPHACKALLQMCLHLRLRGVIQNTLVSSWCEMWGNTSEPFCLAAAPQRSRVPCIHQYRRGTMSPRPTGSASSPVARLIWLQVVLHHQAEGSKGVGRQVRPKHSVGQDWSRPMDSSAARTPRE